MIKLTSSTSFGLMNQNRATAIIASITLGVAVLGGLYWAQSVVIPLALGILFTTIATPVVKLAERWGLSRVPSVVLVTVVFLAVAIGLGWLILAQMSQLVVDLPKYQENIVAKVSSFRSVFRSKSSESWDRMMEKLNRSMSGDGEANPANPASSPLNPLTNGEAASPNSPAAAATTVAAPAEARTGGEPWWMAGVAVALHLLAEVSGHVTLAVIVAIFLLVDREDARNRIIQLIGRGHITQTTKAFDDAGKRISHFLLVQMILNASYGLVLAIGLYFLGVNYAILWGVLAAVLRYVPYVGGSIAAAFPIVLALAQFSSWWPAMVIIGIVLVLELIINNILEPHLYGHSIGVSSVALIVAATFWTFLWGPVGLIMAGPLTVCLVVLGKYVPPLRFLDVLLGNQAPMEKEVILYQRLLAKDETETERIMGEEFKEHSVTEVYDQFVFPAAANAGLDRENSMLSAPDEQYVFDTLTDIMTANTEPIVAPAGSEEASAVPVRLLVVAARGRGDRLGIAALSGTLDPAKYHLITIADGMMGAEIIGKAEDEKVDGVCISALPPGGLSHTKYLCKRLRARLPKVKIFVGHWSGSPEAASGWSGLEADAVVYSLADMQHQLESWRPVLQSANIAASQSQPTNHTPKLTVASAAI